MIAPTDARHEWVIDCFLIFAVKIVTNTRVKRAELAQLTGKLKRNAMETEIKQIQQVILRCFIGLMYLV